MAEHAAAGGVRVDARWNLGTPSHARTVGVAIDDRGYALGREGVDDLIARLTAVREQTWPPAGPASRRECPLPSCTWFHDEPDWPMSLALMPAPTVEQLEQARLISGGGPADPLRDANLANLLIHTQRVETILREHFRTHPLEEWVLEVVRLQAELGGERD